jgi:hypothetical protein
LRHHSDARPFGNLDGGKSWLIALSGSSFFDGFVVVSFENVCELGYA